METNWNFTITAKRTYKALRQHWPIIVNTGGARCFAANTLVHTNKGLKPISSIDIGDVVLTPNGEKPVINTFCMHNKKPCVKIKMKNGDEIICTADHKFWYKNEWVEINNILSLFNEKDTKL